MKKEWYRQPGGMVVAFLLLPFFVIWYAWTKSKWSRNTKVAATVASVILVAIAFAAVGDTPQTPASAPDTKQEEPKKDESLLNATVRKAFDVPGIEVTNNEQVAWENCELQLNDDYERVIRNPLQPNEPLNNPYPLFTKKDGTKFNPETTAPKKLFIQCDVAGSSRYNLYEFS